MSEETKTNKQQAATEKTVVCRVVTKIVRLPHGTAGRDAIVRLKESDFNYHKKEGNVQFLKYA